MKDELTIDRDVFSKLMDEGRRISKDVEVCYMSYVRVRKQITDILLFWDGTWTYGLQLGIQLLQGGKREDYELRKGILNLMINLFC